MLVKSTTFICNALDAKENQNFVFWCISVYEKYLFDL
jgi:hypothetical protein